MSEKTEEETVANDPGVRSDTFVSRPTLRPDTAQDAPLAERRLADLPDRYREYEQFFESLCADAPEGSDKRKHWFGISTGIEIARKMLGQCDDLPAAVANGINTESDQETKKEECSFERSAKRQNSPVTK